MGFKTNRATSRINNDGDVEFQTYSDSDRPSAGTTGRVIYNTDDNNLNIDTGSDWVLPDGTSATA